MNIIFRNHLFYNVGVCGRCHYNTTGDHCELCAQGYRGNALNKTCMKIGKSSVSNVVVPVIDSLRFLHLLTVPLTAVSSILTISLTKIIRFLPAEPRTRACMNAALRLWHKLPVTILQSDTLPGDTLPSLESRLKKYLF